MGDTKDIAKPVPKLILGPKQDLSHKSGTQCRDIVSHFLPTTLDPFQQRLGRTMQSPRERKEGVGPRRVDVTPTLLVLLDQPG